MKAAIRRETIARRNSITHEEVMEKSAMIQKMAMDLLIYRNSKTIGLYANFNNEVSTSLLFDGSMKEGKKVLFPYIMEEKKELIFTPVQGLDELMQGPFGIMAPCNKDGKNHIGEAELLFIPGVAYDLKGGRIGYGGGFYDRSLGKLVKRPFIAALAYELQIVDEVPVRPHDIRVDVIITEQRVITCK